MHREGRVCCGNGELTLSGTFVPALPPKGGAKNGIAAFLPLPLGEVSFRKE